jgi:hypothetical protein
VWFEYFGKVEAYATADKTTDPSASSAAPAASLVGLGHADRYARELWTHYRGGEACHGTSDCPANAERIGTDQPVAQRCVTNPRLTEPDLTCKRPGSCICSSMDADFEAYTAGDLKPSKPTVTRYSPVPYLYCPDNRVNDLSWCSAFDAGESFQEVIDNYRQAWLNSYPEAYFRNYRSAGPARGYSQASVIDAVKIYQHLFFRYNYEGAAFQMSQGALGFSDQLLASADTLNWLGEIIATPDVGSYRLDTASNTYQKTSDALDAPGASVSLAPGLGYYMWSEYQDGLNGFFRLERAGTFLDKVLAIQALAKRDWGLNFTLDERYYINFYDLFDTEVVDLFGGLILREPKSYAPRISFDQNNDAQLTYLSHYRTGDRGNNADTYPGAAVDGVDSEVLRDTAAIEALSAFPVYYDTSFEQRLLVFKLGGGDGYTIAPTRADGTPTCGHGDPGCAAPDYIIYESDRLHTAYVAVKVASTDAAETPEQQLGFQFLLKLDALQTESRGISALPTPTEAQTVRAQALQAQIQREESFLEYLIELERTFGISSSLF